MNTSIQVEQRLLVRTLTRKMLLRWQHTRHASDCIPGRHSCPAQASTCGRSRQVTRHICAVADTTQGITSFPYNSGDANTRQKATLEALGRDAVTMARPGEQKPWAMGFQVNERNLMWNDGVKVALIKRVASQELGISEEEMDWRLSRLAALLPGLEQRLIRAPPKFVARAAAQTAEIGMRLLALKNAFPQADLSIMIGNRLTLLMDDDVEEIKVSAQQLRQLLPGVNVDAFVADYPAVLDVEDFKMALEDCKRLMPDQDPVLLLRRTPDLILKLMKGKNLIIYDQVANPWA